MFTLIVYIERCRKLNNFGQPEGEYEVVRVNDFWYENIPEELKLTAENIFQTHIVPKWFIKEKNICENSDELISGFGKINYSGYRGRRSFMGTAHLRYYAFVAWQNETEEEVKEFLANLYQGEFWQKQGIHESKIFPKDYLRFAAA